MFPDMEGKYGRHCKNGTDRGKNRREIRIEQSKW
jgi:hypothetical protein